VGPDIPYTWGIDDTGTNVSAFPTATNMQTHYLYHEDDGTSLMFQFDNPYYVAPDEPVVEPVARIVPTGGSFFNTYDQFYFETTSEGRFLYGMVEKGPTDRYKGRTRYDVEYEPSDGKFYDAGSAKPSKWSVDDIGTNISAFPTATNMPIQYWYDGSDILMFQFDNPYYVAPDEPGYRYLAFYGTTGSANGWFYELELTTSPGVIDNSNPIPVDKITVVAPIHANSTEPGVYNNPSAIFDGCYEQSPADTLIFASNNTGILFYMDGTTSNEVLSGTYYTNASSSGRITTGKMYGTNTDPTTFVATDEANWNYVCDLTMATEAPPEPAPKYLAIIGSSDDNAVGIQELKLCYDGGSIEYGSLEYITSEIVLVQPLREGATSIELAFDGVTSYTGDSEFTGVGGSVDRVLFYFQVSSSTPTITTGDYWDFINTGFQWTTVHVITADYLPDDVTSVSQWTSASTQPIISLNANHEG